MNLTTINKGDRVEIQFSGREKSRCIFLGFQLQGGAGYIDNMAELKQIGCFHKRDDIEAHGTVVAQFKCQLIDHVFTASLKNKKWKIQGSTFRLCNYIAQARAVFIDNNR